jgi:hypothetical protein
MSRQGKLAALASTGVTKAELDLLDGVTSTTAELNITDGVTSTAAELNILDGVTATAAEINLIDGGTARGTTAVADGDGFLTNDGGTMRMTKVDTLATYMGTKIGGGMEFIASSGAISDGTASVSFTQFDATKYDHYKFFFQYIIPVTDNVDLLGHASTDGGSSYDTTNGNYHIQAADSTGFRVGRRIGSDTNEFGQSGEFTLWAPHNSSVYTYSTTFGTYTDYDASSYNITSANLSTTGSGHLVAQDTDAIQFKFSSGNIEAGEITMFGIVNS